LSDGLGVRRLHERITAIGDVILVNPTVFSLLSFSQANLQGKIRFVPHASSLLKVT